MTRMASSISIIKLSLSLTLLLIQSSFFTLLAEARTGGDPVPVLIWSPERSLSDFPDENSNGVLATNSFKGTYLSPLTIEGSNSAVVFLQDKLHMDDFTKYADVYSVDSTGGSFKNVKNLMEENFSQELAQVSGASSALLELQEKFNGAVHTISSLPELKKLNLEEKFLLLVRLAPTSTSIKEESVIAENDKMIGAVCDHLKEKDIKYTAIYTGERSSGVGEEEVEVHSGRHLLADAEVDNKNGTLMNISTAGLSDMYIFMRSMKVVVKNNNKIVNRFELIPKTNSADTSSKTNKTAQVVIDFPSQKDNVTSNSYNVTLTMNATDQGDRWVISGLVLKIVSGAQDATDIKNGSLVNNDLDLVVPILYSYHCTWLDLYLDTRGIGNSEYSNYTGTSVRIYGFQFQPFMVQRNSFFDSVDCVPFFTLGILMGLVPTVLLLAILLGGTYMLLGLSIMDKYDDPKGKTISVAVGSD